MEKPKSISEWSQLSCRNPDLASQLLEESISGVPENIYDAVFSFIPEPAQLKANFRASVEMDEGVFRGVPYMLKDLFDVKGVSTKAGSSFIHEVLAKPKKSALLFEDMAEKGAVFSGKTHLNEFAYGLSGRNAFYGNVPHPERLDCLSGGSSSGSAWAVASGIIPLAFGTDTVGSIRVPAASCGIYGMRLSPKSPYKDGVFPLAANFDTPGWFTKSAEDMLFVCKELIKSGPHKAEFKGLYIADWAGGVDDEHLSLAHEDMSLRLEAETDQEMIQWFKHSMDGAGAAYTILSTLEVFEFHKHWIDVKKSDYSDTVWQRINRGRMHSEKEIKHASDVRVAIKERFASLFESYDYLAIPVMPKASPKESLWDDAFRGRLLDFNAAVSLAGLPSLVIPVFSEGESAGLQIVFPEEDYNVVKYLLNCSDPSL